jgi:molecular chaperone GrpE
MSHSNKEEKKDSNQSTENDGKINWEEKADEYLNGWKRAKADYMNFKKETEKKQEETVQFANALFISELLPIIDNFSTAVTGAKDSLKEKENSWLVGFSHIGKQFEGLLEKRGIKKIKCMGEMFDPTLHEAIEKQKQKDTKEGIIIKELQTGYTLHGKVLRPAKVAVSG